jgi:hypothetical protein
MILDREPAAGPTEPLHRAIHRHYRAASCRVSVPGSKREPATRVLLIDYWSSRFIAFRRDGGIAQRFDPCPERFPAVPDLGREVDGPRRSNALQVAVREPEPEGFVDEQPVRGGELR